MKNKLRVYPVLIEILKVQIGRGRELIISRTNREVKKAVLRKLITQVSRIVLTTDLKIVLK